MKTSVSKEKFACLRSRWLCGHNFWTLRSNIFVKNEKMSQNHFCLFIWGLGWLKRFDLGPHMKRQKRWCKIFRFRKAIKLQSLKIMCPSSRSIFSLDEEVFMFLNYCYWVCKHTQVLNQLGPYYSLKICEKSFQKCSRSHCCVCIVNNYTDMASV